MSNCSPKKDSINKTASFTYTVPGAGETPPQTITLTFDYIDKYWYEVRPPNLARRTIVNGSKKEKLRASTIQFPIGETDDGEVTFEDRVFYQQEYEILENGSSRPVYERECKADIAYDEQYFYHIFEWPLSHTLPARPAGGFVATTTTSTGVNSEGQNVTTTTTSYSIESCSVSGNLSLAKVDSEVTGIPENTIVYHGGTDDNKIFFYYENTTNKDMIAVGDVVNGWTVNKVVNYNSEHFDGKSVRTTESVGRRVSKLSDKNKTPGFIYINNNDGAEDRIINIGDTVTGYGIQPDTTVTNIQGLKVFLSRPLKYKNKRKVRNVKFTKTELVNNISNQILCYAEITGGSSSFVKDQYYSKETSSTPQYLSRVYHVFDAKKNKNVQLTTTKEIKVEAKEKNDEGGSNNSDNRNHYLVTFLDETVIDNKDDIQILITDDRTASGVEKSFTFVSKVEVVNSKSFKVWFKRNDNKNNTFVRGWTVNRVPGAAVIPENRIQVIAGKGIIDRSAVCGIYISNDKKFYTYTPLFYSRDNFCESTYLEDTLGKFILGNVLLSDGSYQFQQQFLCVAPTTDDAYQINNVFWSYFNRPAEKTELENWIEKLKTTSFLEIQEQITNSEKKTLNNRTVAFVKDSECDNTITPDYTKVYYPHSEFQTFNDYIQPVQENAEFDDCVDVKTPKSYTKEELEGVITSNLEGSFNFSSINLPKEMYNQIVANENSLQNTLLRAITAIGSSVPKQTTIPNLPPLIEGENKSSKIFKTENAYRIPPRFKSLEYVIDDFSFVSDLDLNSESENNKITIQLKTIPRWTGNASSNGQTGSDINPIDGLRIITNKSNGYVTSIQVATEPFNIPEIIPGLTNGSTTKSWVGGSPYPATLWHGQGTNFQSTFDKVLNFRVNEVSKTISKAVRNKGNPFTDEPPYAKLTSEIKTTDTTITVDSTSGFLSSGYIIIPKYIIKKDLNLETKNETLYHYYLGEEIVYYKDKTETQFLQCTRQMFDTTFTFEESVNSGLIESGVAYIIKTLGTVNWKNYGAPDGYAVGTIFTATDDGSQATESGEVYLFESSLTPFPNSKYVIHSYQKNNYLSQFWPIQIQNKNV